MKKGQVCEGIVERVDFPNKGIVKVGEETVVVKNSLPGQKVKLSVNKVRKGKAEGRLLEVVEKSPLETGQPCSHFGLCGGCCYLSMPYEEQLAVKEAQVKKLLDSVLVRQKENYTWEGIKGSPREYEYRNKMEFSFGDEYMGGPLALGMHKRGSFYDIVSVEDCKIVDADYRLILQTVREYFAENNVTFFHRLRHEGYLRHLLVRKASGTGEILVALVTTSQNPWGEGDSIENDGVKTSEIASEQELIDKWLQKLLELQEKGKLQGSFAGILHIVNDSLADVVKSDRTDILYGQDYFYEELLGLKFKISTFSFFQTNSYSAAVLYETAREYVGDLGGKDKTVFDLYSGTGTIAQLMAPAAGKVIGVEIVEEAVEAAKRNAADNGLTNCQFIAGDVLKVLDEVEEKPDMIILDPPRDGIHPKALPKIIAYGVEHIVYISCKPSSLVRDLEVFLENGYVVEKAVAVDQFPWTANVEVVCSISKKSDVWIAQRADPYVYRHTDGSYYFTASVPAYDGIILRKSEVLEELALAEEKMIWKKHENGPMSYHIWAPELHYIFGKWYIYFAAGEKENIWNIRPYVLECQGQDPYMDEWVEMGRMQAADEDEFSFRSFSLDATILENDGKYYYIWAEKVGVGKMISNLYIAEMESATKLKTVQVLLTTPDYDWERRGFWVNEGPSVLKRNGKIFVTYSASDTGINYCMGMLSIEEGADVLDPRMWSKKRYPVLCSDEGKGIYGPGHNSFTKDKEGNDILVFHARTEREIIGDPLYNPNRHAMLMRFNWNDKGEPVFDFDGGNKLPR